MSGPPTIKQHRPDTGNPPTIKLTVNSEAKEHTDTMVELHDGDIVDVDTAEAPPPPGRKLLYIGLPNRKIVRYGPFAKDEVDIPALSIGRIARCNVQIDHREVSRQHVEIRFQGGVFVLRDMGSSGGTWFEDKRVSSLKIEDNMEIQLSKTITVAFRIRARK